MKRFLPHLLLAAVASAQTQSVDVLVDMHNKPSAGLILTPSILAGGTVGGTGTWTTNPSTLTAFKTGTVAPVPYCSFKVAGTSYTGSTGSGWDFLHDYDNQSVRYAFADGKSSVSIGFFFRTDLGPPPSYNYFDFTQFKTDSGKDGYANYDNGASGLYVLRNETTYGGSSVAGANIPINPGTTYWITEKYTAGNPGTMVTAVYDPTTWTQVGSISTGSSDAAVTVNSIYLGQNRTGTSASPGQHSYFSNVVIDYTNAVFPLGVPVQPAPPTNAAAIATSDTTVAVFWTPGDTNEQGFQIWRSTDGVTYSLITTTPAGATSYNDTLLNPSTAYYYEIRAHNINFDSLYTSTGGVSTSPPVDDCVPPDGSVFTSYTFTTIAGSAGVAGSANGVGALASFLRPGRVAVDNSGNVYIADIHNHIIRKMAPNGTVSTLAGLAGSPGSIDGTGAAARFNLPIGIAVDGTGNVFVTEYANNTVRKITPAGVVTTVAGLAGNSGTADGTGTAARFKGPSGVVVDSVGNLFVADTNNNTIRTVSPTGVVTTLAGTAGVSGSTNGTGTAALFSSPRDVALAGGILYVTDSGNNMIRRIAAGGAVTTLAGAPNTSAASTDGTGSAARFNIPEAIATDIAGNIYVSESGGDTVRRITPGGIVTTLAGFPGSPGWADGTGDSVLFDAPDGIAVGPTGTIYVADNFSNVIRQGVVAPAVPTFNTQPANQTLTTGNLATFATSVGGALTFQWQRLPAGSNTWGILSDGTNYSGSTNPVLYVNANTHAMNGDRFRCIATNNAGCAASSTASLTVLEKRSDFNGDGKPDLFWQNSLTGVRAIWLMNGTTFISGQTAGVVSPDWSVAAIADFDGDGQPDLLWQDLVTGERSIWLMNNGSFVSNVSLGDVPVEWSIAGTGDFNGDGNTDILWQDIATGQRSIWLMNGTTFASNVSLGVLPTDWTIAGTGDFNADGQPDIVLDNVITGEGSIWLMSGTTIATSVSLGLLPAPLQIAGTGDYNGDGTTDILWSNPLTGERGVWLMNGTTITGSVSIGMITTDWILDHPVAGRISASPGADFNGDGKCDLVWQNSLTGERTIWLMDGISYSSAIYLGIIGPDWSIAGTGDFNADGQTDLVWQNVLTGAHTVWLMNGGAYLSSLSLGIVSTDWKIAAIADFNSDGKPDLVWQNTVTGERTIWLMNGGNKIATISLGVVSTDWSIAGAADFNGDGKPDILWQNTVTGERTVWLMNETTFVSNVSLGVVSTDWSIAGTGDFNGDGKADIIWQNSLTGKRNVWLMDGTTFVSGASFGIITIDWSIRN